MLPKYSVPRKKKKARREKGDERRNKKKEKRKKEDACRKQKEERRKRQVGRRKHKEGRRKKGERIKNKQKETKTDKQKERKKKREEERKEGVKEEMRAPSRCEATLQGTLRRPFKTANRQSSTLSLQVGMTEDASALGKRGRPPLGLVSFGEGKGFVACGRLGWVGIHVGLNATFYSRVDRTDG